MKPERLQEIKESWAHQRITEIEIMELLSAYENQGELLQLSLANVDRLKEELARWRVPPRRV